jgi:casein kinase 1
MHERHLIHRRIHPENFQIGPPSTKVANVIHVVRVGKAEQYRDPKTKSHIPYRERVQADGMPVFMSINAHLGRKQSRRDDLEALGHVFMYFLRGRLPWQGLKATTKKLLLDKIGEQKQLTRIKALCGGFPGQFVLYFLRSSLFIAYCIALLLIRKYN